MIQLVKQVYSFYVAPVVSMLISVALALMCIIETNLKLDIRNKIEHSSYIDGSGICGCLTLIEELKR